MRKIYFFLPILHFLLYEIAIARIELRELVVTYDQYGQPKTMHIMATNTRGTSMRTKYSANIYCSPNYGYYEMFMCANLNTPYTTGCLHEIVTEKSFRFANVGKPNFSWFIDKFSRHELRLVKTTKFELCIVDGTQDMRKSFLKKSKANLGQRIKMQRYCWVIKLEHRPISNKTLLEMKRATKLELKGKRKKLYNYKKQFDERLNAKQKSFNELKKKMKELFTKSNNLRKENEILKKELEKARTSHNSDTIQKSDNEVIKIVKEVKDQFIIVNEMHNHINQFINDENKIKDDLEKEVAVLENKIINEEEKDGIGTNNEVIIEERNILDPAEQIHKLNPENPALGLSEEEIKNMERALNNLTLNLRKKRNAEPIKRINSKKNNKDKNSHVVTKELKDNDHKTKHSTVEHFENKSPEKWPFHAKKVIFTSEKMNNEKVNPHAKFVPKFADVQLGNLKWNCAKFHGKNAENCRKWEKIAGELENNAKTEYRSLLLSGKCSAKGLGINVLKHSILNALNIAKGSNGKDGIQIGEAPLTEAECKEKLHKGMQHLSGTEIDQPIGLTEEEIKNMERALKNLTLNLRKKRNAEPIKRGNTNEQNIKNRHKRNVEDDDKIWEKLYKIVPRKQAMLFKLASNDLLTLGNIEIDDLRNEIAEKTNVKAEQLLDYDEKGFEKLADKFGKKIFHKMAQNRVEKIIKDAEDKFEDVFGIYSTLQLSVKDNKEIDETMKNIEKAEEQIEEKDVSMDEYCKKECMELIEYDEKIGNEIEKEEIKKQSKTEGKGKEIVEHKEPKKMEENKTGITEIVESEIKNHGEHEATGDGNDTLSKIYNTSKEYLGNIGNKKIVEHREPEKMEENKTGKKEIVESEIENHGEHKATGDGNGVLSKIYNTSKEYLGNIGKFVGKKNQEIVSNIGHHTVIQSSATSNAMAKERENSTNMGGDSNQPAKTPGTAHIRLGHDKYLHNIRGN